MTSDPIRPAFLPKYSNLRSNDWNFLKLCLEMFRRLLINKAKSNFISDQIWPPFWPTFRYWESAVRFSWKFDIQWLSLNAILIVKSDLTFDPAFWPNYWSLEINNQNFRKIGLHMVWWLLKNTAKSDFMPHPIWLPSWPNVRCWKLVVELPWNLKSWGNH